MAATQTVARRPPLRNSETEPNPQPGLCTTNQSTPTAAITPITAVPHHGALFIYGFGCRLRVAAGHLLADWGIADERYTTRIPRAGGGLERLVIIGASGYVTFSLMRWCRDLGVSLILLERNGSLINIVSPGRAPDAALRRAQCMAALNGKDLLISRELIRRKLAGQAALARDRLKDMAAAAMIASLCDSLKDADTLDEVRRIEAVAGRIYFGAWAPLEIRWPRRDLERIPARWQTFGARMSSLTDGPRRAVTAASAMLNFVNIVALSEATIGLNALGFDASIGWLHFDIVNRPSLSCDTLEAIRPEIEGWLYDWLTSKTLSRAWFHELPDGECRMSLDLCRELSATARIWRAKIAPVCEWLTEVLDGRKVTPLSKRRARESHGSSLALRVAGPAMPSFCAECGAAITGRQYCPECYRAWNTEGMRKIFTSGLVAARDPRVIARRVETNAQQRAAQSRWDRASLPQWLSPEVYDQEIKPLPNVTTSAIAKKLGVSSSYAVKIRKGQKCPHARFWLRLAELAGYTPEAPQPFGSAAKA